ncbi:MAG: DUF2795 domain-containing protein [Nanoarchaeota archaeon]|nr:DUF2795 domain-containing protein [Nanoarchaeota archaeon]
MDQQEKGNKNREDRGRQRDEDKGQQRQKGQQGGDRGQEGKEDEWIPDFLQRINYPTTKDEIIDSLKNNKVSQGAIDGFSSISERTYQSYEDLKMELNNLGGDIKNKIKNWKSEMKE